MVKPWNPADAHPFRHSMGGSASTAVGPETWTGTVGTSGGSPQNSCVGRISGGFPGFWTSKSGRKQWKALVHCCFGRGIQ